MKVGDRVRVTANSGFSRGSRGTISSFTETEKGTVKVFVRRDGSNSDAYFYLNELEPYVDPVQPKPVPEVIPGFPAMNEMIAKRAVLKRMQGMAKMCDPNPVTLEVIQKIEVELLWLKLQINACY